MHESGLAHLDLKLENLLLKRMPSGSHRAIIADFDRTVRCGREGARRSGGGSPNYRAPEMLDPDAEVEQPADIWALGVCVYRMLTGQFPFPGVGRNWDGHVRCVFDGDVASEPLRAAGVSGEAEEFIMMSVRVDPAERAEIGALADHRWLQQIEAST